MEEPTAREKEVLRSLLSMERGQLGMAEVPRSQQQHTLHVTSQPQQQQQQPQQQPQQQQHMNHHYTQPEEPHNLSTSQHHHQAAPAAPRQQQPMAGIQQRVAHQHHQHQHPQQHHTQHQQHQPPEHQQHSIQQQQQQNIYKPSSTQPDPAMHGCVQWMTPAASTGHQVIILHAQPEQQSDTTGGSGMASIIQAAEQGQLVGQQVWETHVADYQAGVQLSDGTIIPTHPDYQPHNQCGNSMPQQGYLLIENKEASEGTEGTATSPVRKLVKKKKVKVRRKLAELLADGFDPNRLEESATEVQQRFEKGCECESDSCFKSLSPEYVYRHRLNIAELSKHEHDMYLMGVTMASLSNWDETARHKERKRLRTKYVFQGKAVCLDAFLYLENCTHYQLKKIRKHVITHGVTPRVHGNHGKRPHNTFPLDIYQHAHDFLAEYLVKFAHKGEVKKSKAAAGATIRRQSILIPPDVNRKKIHELYVEFVKQRVPNTKIMSYSAFRHFLRKQFGHVRFTKPAPPTLPSDQVQHPSPHVSAASNGASTGDVKLEDAQSAPAGTAEPEPAVETSAPVPAPISTLVPEPGMEPEASQLNVEFSVPEHHQTTTYTVTSRPYVPATLASVQMHYANSSYHYSVAM